MHGEANTKVDVVNSNTGRINCASAANAVNYTAANADNTATSLRGIGILPAVKQGSSQGKKFWRVIVGPSGSSSERATLLKKVKDLGFNDAYFVTN